MNLTKRCACADSDKCKHPWSYQFRLNGRLVRKSTRTSVHKVALDVARAAHVHRIKVDAKIADDAPVVKAITLGKLVAKYEAFYRSEHPVTARVYGSDALFKFRDALGAATLVDDITSWRIVAWRNGRIGKREQKRNGDRGRPLSRGTVNRDFKVIKGLFRQAVIWRADTGLTTNPLTGVELLRTDDKEVRVATTDELAQLKDAPALVRRLCELTITSLARLSEVAYLRPDDLKNMNPAKPRIQVRRKGGKRQMLPITVEQMTELRSLVTSPKQKFVMFGVDEKVPERKALSRTISEWWRSRGTTLHHHAMRHTAATALLSAGISPRAIMELGGWSSLQMLERYGHVLDHEIDRAIDTTTALLGKQPELRSTTPLRAVR